MTSVFDFTVALPGGGLKPLSDYADRVLLIVNTASRCGFTPQYSGLEALFRTFGPRGLVVLGFPCNQFGAQEPGDAAEIGAFCATRYAISFPIFAKLEVNGPGADPLFVHLKQACPGLLGSARIKWNFTKFLVGRDGAVIRRYAPARRPDALSGAIEKALAV